jgi:hypothetical protein
VTYTRHGLYSGISVVARLFVLVLAFVMAGSPIVTTACLTVCAAREAAATVSGAMEHRSCHSAAPSQTPAISGAGHACEHSDGDQVSADQTLQSLRTAADVSVVELWLSPPLIDTPRVRAARILHSPAASFPFGSAPLRL